MSTYLPFSLPTKLDKLPHEPLTFHRHLLTSGRLGGRYQHGLHRRRCRDGRPDRGDECLVDWAIDVRLLNELGLRNDNDRLDWDVVYD